MRLPDQVAVVTGAGRGIGRGIALELAAEGARVAIADINHEAACRVRDEIVTAGGSALAVRTDVTSRADIDGLLQQTIGEFGRLDIWVNNAGILSLSSVTDMSEELWDRTFAVNTKAQFLGCAAAARHMIAHEVKGRIINLSSQGGITGVPYSSHYAASKFAVIGLTQSLAYELAPHGITVNAVCPGVVLTDLTLSEAKEKAAILGQTPEACLEDWLKSIPLGRYETPRDVARVVVFLASDDASYITGESLNVNGGTEMH